MAGRYAVACVGRGVWRVWLLAVFAGLGLMLAPVPQALADERMVGTVQELADAFADGPASGSRTVTLIAPITGTTTSPEVAVPGGAKVVLDLNGMSLTLIGRGGKAGLGLPVGAELTIIDTTPTPGTLNTAGGYYGAGIGGGRDSAGGTVRVAGGVVNATGGDGAAGIGGGYPSGGGTVTIDGGVVTATGGLYAAGIGGGMWSAGGKMTVAGGVVTATGGLDGAGIGGGRSGGGADVEIAEGAVVMASGVSGIAVGPGLIGTGFGSLANRGRLTVPASNAITVPDGVTVTNAGVLEGAGKIVNHGAIVNTGTVDITVTVHHVQVSFRGTEDPLANAVVYAASFAQAQQELPEPVQQGQSWVGWYTEESGGERVTDTTDLGDGLGDDPKELVLYARWVADPPEAQLCVRAEKAAVGSVIDEYTVVAGNGGSGKQIVRADGNKRVTGGSGDDVVCGWNGNNTLDGGSGNDLIIAVDGVGGNRLLGGTGNDTLIGVVGDTFDGGSGNNQITRLGGQPRR